jgi:hypothetical protein
MYRFHDENLLLGLAGSRQMGFSSSPSTFRRTPKTNPEGLTLSLRKTAYKAAYLTGSGATLLALRLPAGEAANLNPLIAAADATGSVIGLSLNAFFPDGISAKGRGVRQGRP